MTYNENELQSMMESIKNLKKNNQNNSLNINTNPQEKTDKSQSVNMEKKETDTSFYSRIFNHKTPNSVNEKYEMDKKFIEDYFQSEEGKKMMENIVNKVILESATSKHYLEYLVSEIIKEYTKLNDSIKSQIEEQINTEVTKIIRDCLTNLGNTLLQK